MIIRFIRTINFFPMFFEVRGFKTILDVGCGFNCPVNYFITKDQKIFGLDIDKNVIAKQEQKQYQEIYISDIRDFSPSTKYNLVVALDFIEHFEKKEGYQILDRMENIASQRVLVITPNGYLPQPPSKDNPWQEHKSGWSVADFRERGYRVYGLFGPKFLRGQYASLKYRPKIIFGLLSFLLSIIYFWLPERSFSLLAIYDKGPKIKE